MKRHRIGLAALLGLLALSGCAMHDDFLKAQAAGTQQAWGDFVSKYPVDKNPQCDDCRTADRNYKDALSREENELRQAEATGTAAAYLAFLSARAAGNPHYAQAQDAARGLLAKGEGEEEDYETFFAKFPGDGRLADVRRGLRRLRYRAAKRARDADACGLFLAEYPGTPEAEQLKPTCERLEFETARRMKTRLALEFFLKRFPDSAQAGAASELLAGLPRAETVVDDGGALELLPRLREASAELRASECAAVLADSERAAGDPAGASAEKVRDDFAGFLRSGDVSVCVGRSLAIPASSRASAAGAIRALAKVSQRQMRLASIFDGTQALADKARQIGQTAAQLAEQAESFDLEMQAYYGFMPADPDKPQEKAAKDAKEAERRAHRAYDEAEGGDVAAKKAAAAEVLRLMDDQKKLLVKIIAYYERPDRGTP
jgi:hypothetical protein